MKLRNIKKIASVMILAVLLMGCKKSVAVMAPYEYIDLDPSCRCSGAAPGVAPVIIAEEFLERIVRDLDFCLVDGRIESYDLPNIVPMDRCECAPEPPERSVIIDEYWFMKAVDLIIVCDESLKREDPVQFLKSDSSSSQLSTI